ncbi:hypothetical protein NQZ68_039989 [Dissostichus eleginoides]|nr:hypothetical protein NQZ68_039989 [Dissostichus eleginoides]
MWLRAYCSNYKSQHALGSSTDKSLFMMGKRINTSYHVPIEMAARGPDEAQDQNQLPSGPASHGQIPTLVQTMNATLRDA